MLAGPEHGRTTRKPIEKDKLGPHAVPLVMIVAEIAFLCRRRIEPEHHKHNARSYDEAHGGGSF